MLTPLWAIGARSDAQECAYVIDDLGDAISIVDPSSRSVADSVAVVDCALPEPQLCQLTSIALNADASRAYVTQLSPGVVYVVDLIGETLIDEIEVEQGASAAVLTASGTRLYVANLGGDSVSVVDTGSNSVIDTIAVGDGPRALALTPDEAQLLVANRAGTVSVIRTSDGEVVNTVNSGDQPAGIAISPNGAAAYVTNQMAASVIPIELPSFGLRAAIPVGDNPRDVVFAPDSATAFVANIGTSSGPDTVTVVNVTSGTTTGDPIVVGDGPVALALNDAGDTLYVANLSDRTVSIVDTATRAVESVPDVPDPFDLALGACPEGLATPTPEVTPTPTGGSMCVGDCGGDGSVTVSELIQGVNIALGNAPLSNCPVFDRSGNQMVDVNELVAAVLNASNGCPA